ncbi:MAG: serine hydrolase [Aquabacterium sp.]|nr:serine hydrolase [Aquabacterium sp.]
MRLSPSISFNNVIAAAALAAAVAAPVGAQTLPPQLFLPEVLLPRDQIGTSSTPQLLPTASPKAPIANFRYEYGGVSKSLTQFQQDGKVRALLVLKDGKIVYEYNKFPYGKSSLHQSWSISKQMLSTLVGIALDECAIRSVDDRMDAYAPELAINGFAGVTFKQALQMSSGIKYNEEVDRFNLFFDVINDYYSVGASGFTLREKTLDPAMTRAYAPGSKFEYASINSQAIAMALEKAVGVPYQQYFEQKLWKAIGTEDKAKMLTDRTKTAFTFCCNYATTRSYALFGLLYAQGGRLNGRQIVSQDWVTKATTYRGDPSNWRAVALPGLTGVFGFGYHWWPMDGDRGDFSALGVYGQSIHILPKDNTVIVRVSGDFDVPGAHSEEAAAMGRALANYLR